MKLQNTPFQWSIPFVYKGDTPKAGVIPVLAADGEGNRNTVLKFLLNHITDSSSGKVASARVRANLSLVFAFLIKYQKLGLPPSLPIVCTFDSF